MVNEFVNWLNDELRERGWSNTEFARRANVSPSTISMLLSGQSHPGLDFCVGAGTAFHVPPEDVLRKAGLLPSLRSADDKLISELVTIAKNLNARERSELLAYARWRYQRQGFEYPSGGKSAGGYLQESKTEYSAKDED